MRVFADDLAPEVALERGRALRAELETARAALSRLARACHATREGPCPIIAAFEDGAQTSCV